MKEKQQNAARTKAVTTKTGWKMWILHLWYNIELYGYSHHVHFLVTCFQAWWPNFFFQLKGHRIHQWPCCRNPPWPHEVWSHDSSSSPLEHSGMWLQARCGLKLSQWGTEQFHDPPATCSGTADTWEITIIIIIVIIILEDINFI